MELMQLRYLAAVADTGNFTRAAERCHVAQPSLSQQIINLEKELGHKLFHRLGRRAVLTEAGVVFLQRAQRILHELDDAEKEMRDSDLIYRTITIGMIPTLAPSLLPPLLAMCKTRFPQLEIRAREDFREELIEGVVSGALDLAILVLPVSDPRLACEALYEEPLLLALGRSHPLGARQKVGAEDLKTQPFAMMGTRSTLADDVRAFFRDAQLEPLIRFQCSQLSTLKALVAQGEAITILPQGNITPEDRTRLIIRQLSGPVPRRKIGIIRHQLRYQSRGAEQFLSVLRAHAGSDC